MELVERYDRIGSVQREAKPNLRPSRQHCEEEVPPQAPARHVAEFSGAQYPVDVQGPVTCLA
jgi:hypothetical protein